MVFRERSPVDPEREALLASRDPYYRLRKSYLSRVSWKSVLLGLLAGLIPFILWVAIFQDFDDPTATANSNVLQQSAPSTSSSFPAMQPVVDPSIPANSALKSKNVVELPVLKSIGSSPNWKKVSTKSYRKRDSTDTKSKTNDTVEVHTPTEFGTYSQPTFVLAGNKTIATYHLIVTKSILSPDGFPQAAYLINGQSPGPEIRVKQHSILVVHVTNKLSTPLTFHFHGLHQRKSFLSDGVPHVTQDPIPPGGSFTYEMNLWPQVGTFFYHAHTNMDIMWLFGPLIIEDTPEHYQSFPQEYQYDEERVFILNGIYHIDMAEMVEGIIGLNHIYPNIVNSVTINGRSFEEWTNNVSGQVLSAPTDRGYDITSVKQGLRYRFRFINAASDSLLSCNISSHTLTVIEMDGIYTEPVESDHIAISPGQRYSVIIKMDQETDNYYIACRHMESPGPLNGLAVLKYHNATEPTKEMPGLHTNGSMAMVMERWVIDDLVPNHSLNQTDVYQVPVNVDKDYFLDVFEASWGKQQVYLINGHHYEDPIVPYYKQLQQGINITDIPQVYELIEGEVVQFVFQNTRKRDFCFSHPWHIHGHSFHVVGEGPNKYNPVVDAARIQRDVESGKKFQLRDSVAVFANQTVGELTDGAYCGWAAIRFVAHNNGLWFGHCHVTPHLMMGKKFVIWEHSKDDPMLTELMNMKFNYTEPSEPGGW